MQVKVSFPLHKKVAYEKVNTETIAKRNAHATSPQLEMDGHSEVEIIAGHWPISNNFFLLSKQTHFGWKFSQEGENTFFDNKIVPL